MTGISPNRLALIAILSACIAYGTGMGLTLPLLSLILERMGVPGSLNGLNLATAGLSALVITPYVPGWIHKIGTAQLLVAALAVAAAALVTIYHVPSLWLFFPARFVLGSALNALFVVTEFWINRLADERNRGRYVALYTICMAGSFGIGPAILQVIGTRGFAPFGLGAALLSLAIIPVLLVRRSAPLIEERATSSVWATLRSAPMVFAASCVFGAIDSGIVGLVPVYAVRLGYSEAHAALCVTAVAAGSIVFQYPLGMLADRMHRRTLMVICAASGVAGAIVLPFTMATPLLAYLVLFVWGGMILGIYSVGLTLLGQRFKGAELVTANAGFIIAYCLGMIAGPAAQGIALDAWNPHGLMAAMGLICAIYVGFLLAGRRRLTSEAA